MMRLMKTGFVAAIAMIASATAVVAADYYKTAGSLAVYLGVLPAEMVQGHSPEHPAGRMHGGVPSARRQHHVVVAVFDAKDGARIGDAAVKARVTGVGAAPVEKKLAPMTLDKTISYGNYFPLGGPGRYRIEIEILRPGSSGPVKTHFEYSHPQR